MAIRLVAMDLDGTLVDSRRNVSEYTKKVIAKYAALGVAFVFCSGRVDNEMDSVYAALPEVKYAILENNGSLSVFSDDTDYPMPLILDGVIDYEVLSGINKDYKWLKKQVEKFNMIPEEALVVTIDGKGQIFCQKREKGA